MGRSGDEGGEIVAVDSLEGKSVELDRVRLVLMVCEAGGRRFGKL